MDSEELETVTETKRWKGDSEELETVTETKRWRVRS